MGGFDALLVLAAGGDEIAGGDEVTGVAVVLDVVGLDGAVAVGDDDAAVEGEVAGYGGLGVSEDLDVGGFVPGGDDAGDGVLQGSFG